MDETSQSRPGVTGRRQAIDRALYTLFGDRAERSRHVTDRETYRGTALTSSFEIYIARVYALSWVVGLLLSSGCLLLWPLAAPVIGGALVVGAVGKHGVIRLGRQYLQWRETARRVDIDQTLPGAVRYLRVLATGSQELSGMFKRVADNETAYGQTAVVFRSILHREQLSGSLGDGIRSVARETPSETLGPFLLKLQDHASRGQQELQSYLQLESRMLGHQRTQDRKRRHGLLELLAELFVVLLVLPALLVIVVSVLSVLSTGLDRPLVTPFGTVPARVLLIYGCGVSILIIGAVTASTVETLKPHGYRQRYRRPTDYGQVLKTTLTNPASAMISFVPLGIGAGIGLAALGVQPVNVGVLAYSAWAIPVGLVAIRRAHQDDTKDRELRDFVHAVAGHTTLGRPFPLAVQLVAKENTHRSLQADIADLAFNTNLTTRDRDVQLAALERFGDRVGTPLARQTVGLLSGALAAGSKTEAIFDALESEVGRLYHEKRSLRSSMQIYVAIGWTTALLIIAIVVAVNAYVVEGFTQLAAVANADAAIAFDQGSVDPDAMAHRFYLVTQATMLACGWFAGVASRGRYVALLHSGALLVIAYGVFTVVGLV